MDVSAAATAFLFVGFALFMASIWAWLLVALRIAISRGWLPARLAVRAADLLTSLSLPAKLPLIPWNIRRAVPWGLIDLILLFGIWVVASLAAELVLRQFGLVRVGTKMESLALAQR
jgi:hypothetical protein